MGKLEILEIEDLDNGDCKVTWAMDDEAKTNMIEIGVSICLLCVAYGVDLADLKEHIRSLADAERD